MNPAVRKQLGIGIVQRYKSAIPPPGYEKTVLLELQDRVNSICKKCINRSKVDFFGSVATGFMKKGADADFSLTWSGYNFLCQGHENFDDTVNKKLLRLAKTCAEEGMEGVRHVASRIPVVQFQDTVNPEILVDISVGNVGGVENSKVLRLIHDLHPIFAVYIFAIKEFGKSRQLIAPECGTFNSFTQTVMALSVLQELGLLPVFSRQTGLWGEMTLDDAKFVLSPEQSGFKLHPAIANLNPNDEAAMGDAVLFMLSKYAEYYTNFNFEQGTISMTHPRQTRAAYRETVNMYLAAMKESKREAWKFFNEEHLKAHGKVPPIDENELSQAMHDEETQRTSTSPFVVVDFINYVCCGRRVHLPKKAYVMKQFHDLNEMLNSKTAGGGGTVPDLTADILFQATNELKPIVTDFDSRGARRVTRF